MSSFQNLTLGYVHSIGSSTNDIAQKLGVSANAIAGAIANEFDSRLTNSPFSALGSVAQMGADIIAMSASDARLKVNFIETQSITDAQLATSGAFFKFSNPVLIDVGPGNISIRTAIRLLDDYAANNPADPLNILQYKSDYARLVSDLVDWNSDATPKFAGLMIAEGQMFFQEHASNWSALSDNQKDALLVTYYKTGQERFEQDYLAAANTGSQYTPVIGGIGQQQIENASALQAALGGSPPGIPVFTPPEGIDTIAVAPNDAQSVLGHQFDGTWADTTKLLAAVADGNMFSVANLVTAASNDRYIAPFDNASNKIVVSGDENGSTVGTVSAGFLQHITALPISGIRIDTAFAPDGSQLKTTTDLTNQYGWAKEIVAKDSSSADAGKIDVNDNGTVASATYYGGGVSASDLGTVIGSNLGKLLGGNSLIGQVAAGTLAGAIGKEVGNALFANAGFSLGDVVADGLANVPGGFAGGLPSAGVGALSSLLMGEVADALHLSGFEHGLFQTVGTSITSQLVTNAFGVATVSINPATGAAYTLFDGFNTAGFVTNISGVIGGYLGSTLAAHVILPEYPQGATGEQVGTSIGGAIGAIVGLPGGPFGSFIASSVGAFVGGAFGSFIGDWFGTTPRAWGDLQFDPGSHHFIVDDGTYGQTGGTNMASAFNFIAHHQADVINGLAPLRTARRRRQAKFSQRVAAKTERGRAARQRQRYEVTGRKPIAGCSLAARAMCRQRKSRQFLVDNTTARWPVPRLSLATTSSHAKVARGG